MIRLVVKNEYHKDKCYDEIGACMCSNIDTFTCSIPNTIGTLSDSYKDLHFYLLHLNFDFEIWNDNLHDLQLQTR